MNNILHSIFKDMTDEESVQAMTEIKRFKETGVLDWPTAEIEKQFKEIFDSLFLYGWEGLGNSIRYYQYGICFQAHIDPSLGSVMASAANVKCREGFSQLHMELTRVMTQEEISMFIGALETIRSPRSLGYTFGGMPQQYNPKKDTWTLEHLWFIGNNQFD